MGATNEGLIHAMTTVFPTSPNAWYMGLINASPTPVFSNTDTLAQVGGTNGWSEFTGYTGARILWTNGTPSGNSVTNSSPLVYTITATTASVYGSFLCSVASGTAGTLYSTRAFPQGAQAVTSGYTFAVTQSEGGASS